MTLYDELIARGLIAQVTNEEEIKNMINNGKATFYIGFDCTADSLHVGHFMALCLMKRLQMAGNKPIALIGDGTTLIGDVIESQFKTAYNPNLGAAMSLVLMILIFICVAVMNRFGEGDGEEVIKV